jgi:uncharacterized SAM-binding protein YcdF (DUF218 family)
MARIFTEPRHGRLRRAAPLLAALGLLVLAWLSGFLWFSLHLPAPVPDSPGESADAVVALTGGEGRIQEGFRLLAEGRAGKLFVSGVYRGAEVEEILEIRGLAPAEWACCIVLGKHAADTKGNARESADWIAANNYHSIYLVTSAYHMPRSLAEFRAALPRDVRILPRPVVTDRFAQGGWWRDPSRLRLFASEFNKFLVAKARELVYRLHG